MDRSSREDTFAIFPRSVFSMPSPDCRSSNLRGSRVTDTDTCGAFKRIAVHPGAFEPHIHVHSVHVGVARPHASPGARGAARGAA